MNGPVKLTDDGGLEHPERQALLEALKPMRMLEELVRWGFAQSPPLNIQDVIVQDEYSHDVVMRWRSGRYLVFDTT
jgi:hypothetical protein